MPTFGELADASAEDAVATSVLLRRLKILASRAHLPELESWVDFEMLGWPSSDGLPDYRGPFEAVVLAHISGPGGRGYENYQLPPSAFSDKAASSAQFNLVFLQSITELESIIAGEEKGWQERWSADFVRLTNQLIRAGGTQINQAFIINQAYKVIPPTAVVGVVDAVRSRILKLALDLEALTPSSTEPLGPSEHVRAVQVVNTRIYGGTHNIAIASTDVAQYVTTVVPGDKGSLFAALAKLGIAEPEIEALDQALVEDGTVPSTTASEPGEHVKRWCWNLMVGGARFAGNVTGQLTAALAAQAVLHFFGL